MIAKSLFLSVLIVVTHFVVVFGQARPDTPNAPIREIKKDQQKAGDQARLKRDLEIQTFVLGSKAQSPEISSDLLLTFLATKIMSDPKKRKEIIEDIYRQGAEVKEPLRMAFRSGLMDTRSGYLSYSYDLELDRLSIQLRAIKMMLALDKQRARTLFRDMSQLTVKPLSCEDDLVYEISDYYKVLKDIVDQTFDPEARVRREQIYLATEFIDEIRSPAQVESAIAFLVSVKTTPAEFGILLDSLTATMRKISADPRTFGFSMANGSMTRSIKFKFLSKIEEKGFVTSEFLKGYRSYLVKQLSGTRCLEDERVGSEEKPDDPIVFANTLFENPITEDEIKPEKIEPRTKVFVYWRTPKSAKLLTNIKKLRFGNSKTALSLEQRSHQEWQESLAKYLEQMNDWKSEDEATEADYLHQRGVLYHTLIELTPPGPMFLSVLQDYGLFLRDSRMIRDSPTQWLTYVKYLLKIGKTLKAKDRDEFVKVLRSSGNQIFPLYLDLESLQSSPSR